MKKRYWERREGNIDRREGRVDEAERKEGEGREGVKLRVR